MKVIVIDKSVLQGAPKGILCNLQEEFTFLLTDTLLYEIGTQRMGRGPAMAPAEEDRRNASINATLNRALEEAGDTWVERESAIRWEVECGVSAGAEDAPRLNLHETGVSQILSISGGLYRACMEYEASIGRMASTAHAQADEAKFQRVLRLKEVQLFEELRRDYCSPEGRDRIAKEAKETIGQRAKDRGYQVAPSFDPSPCWLAFGMILSKMIYLPWKFWHHRDDPPDTVKPANAWFDTDYIAYMAIADGLLSADNDQLKLAWVCWAEKESSIYSFNTKDHRITQFHPEWSQ